MNTENAYNLGKIAALYTAGFTSDPINMIGPTQKSKSNKNEVLNDTLTTEGVENILPAKALGGSTNSGVNELYVSTNK